MLVSKLFRTRGHFIRRMALVSIPAGLLFGILEEGRIQYIGINLSQAAEDGKAENDIDAKME